MRSISVVTTARADYGIYLPLLRRIQEDSDLSIRLIVSGMHLSQEFGLTVKLIEQDGFEIADRIEMLLSSDTPEGIVKSIGLGMIGFAQAYARSMPDILIVLGDRFEMHSAALSALPFKIPVAHIHGGELTLGAIDDSLRHSMTKLSHLHFVSTQEYATRVMQLGEESWRVTVSGAPGLDNLKDVNLLNHEEFGRQFEVHLDEDFLLVTYHPVTLEYEKTEWQVGELLSALENCNRSILFTMTNADTSGRLINSMIQNFVKEHPTAQIAANLGTQGYFSAMALAAAMVGNSSSGIIEAASFKLPVVNIGNRQRGRVCGRNVISVGYPREEILSGIEKTTSPQFRSTLSDMDNLYGDGHAAQKIVDVLKQVELDETLIQKQFNDIKS